MAGRGRVSRVYQDRLYHEHVGAPACMYRMEMRVHSSGICVSALACKHANGAMAACRFVDTIESYNALLKHKEEDECLVLLPWGPSKRDT